jgi:hypothetical protein
LYLFLKYITHAVAAHVGGYVTLGRWKTSFTEAHKKFRYKESIHGLEKGESDEKEVLYVKMN